MTPPPPAIQKPAIGRRDEANWLVFERLARTDPVLVNVQRAGDVLPGMRPDMVLTGGPLLPWSDYDGIPRRAILYAAMHEGLASSVEEADAGIRSGQIALRSAHDHGLVATAFAVCTASMPLLVVEDRATGRRGCSNLFEGDSQRRIGTGCYGEDVIERLRFVEQVLAPTIGDAVRRIGGLPLMPIVRRALRLGDDMHVRTTASTMHFLRALQQVFGEQAMERDADVQRTCTFLEAEIYSFARVWLASAKAMSDGAGGVEGSSIVTAMSMNARSFAIRVSGLGDKWFYGPHPRFEGRIRPISEESAGLRVLERFHAEGQAEDAGEWMGRERPVPDDCRFPGTDCMLGECFGLGAFVSAAAFPIQSWHGVSSEEVAARNLAMYDITWGEHPELRIPRFASRGAPLGIDIFKVLDSGTTPMLNGVLMRNDGVVLGTGVCWTPIECFEEAARAYRARYGDLEAEDIASLPDQLNAGPG